MAMEADPYDAVAAGDLALLKARQHQYSEAVKLWKLVVDHDPAQVGAAMNLAIVQCGLGDRDSALNSLDQLLAFSPDDAKARELADQIRSGSRQCGMH